MARDGRLAVGGVLDHRAALSRLASSGRLQHPGARANVLHPDRQHAALFAAGLGDQPSDLIARRRAASTRLPISLPAALAATAPASTAAAAVLALSRSPTSIRRSAAFATSSSSANRSGRR